MAKPISQTHDNSIGTLQINRGLSESGNKLVCWDVVDKCSHQECPAAPVCPYESRIDADGNCHIMRAYMRSATMTVFRGQKMLTAAQTYQIGMHIMPLYRTLCRMKIEEIGIRRILYEDGKGIYRVNPLYKEIRETIKTISVVWKEIGVKAEAPSPKFSGFDAPGASSEDTSYYDAMEKEALGELG